MSSDMEQSTSSSSRCSSFFAVALSSLSIALSISIILLPVASSSLESFPDTTSSNFSATIAANLTTAEDKLVFTVTGGVEVLFSSQPPVSAEQGDEVQLKYPTSEIDSTSPCQSSWTSIPQTETASNESPSLVPPFEPPPRKTVYHDADVTNKPRTLRQKSSRQESVDDECAGIEGNSDYYHFDPDKRPHYDDDDLEQLERRQSYNVIGEENEDLVEIHIRSNIMTKIEIRDWYAEFPSAIDPINFEPSWPSPPPPPTTGNGPVAHIDLTVRTWSTVDREPAAVSDLEDTVEVEWPNAVVINQTSHRYDLAVQSRQVIGGGRPRHVTVYVIQLDRILAMSDTESIVRRRSTSHLVTHSFTIATLISIILSSLMLLLVAILAATCIWWRRKNVNTSHNSSTSTRMSNEELPREVGGSSFPLPSLPEGHQTDNIHFDEEIIGAQSTSTGQTTGKKDKAKRRVAFGCDTQYPASDVCSGFLPESACSTPLVDGTKQHPQLQPLQQRSPFRSSRSYQIYVLSTEVDSATATTSGMTATSAAAAAVVDSRSLSRGAPTTHNFADSPSTSSAAAPISGTMCVVATLAVVVVCAVAVTTGYVIVVMATTAVGSSTSSQTSCAGDGLHRRHSATTSVVVFLSPGDRRLDSVRLFVSDRYPNIITADQWRSSNLTRIQVFNLIDDVSWTDMPPCHEYFVCPSAASQGLAGCDQASRQCVCQAGYQLERGVCTDIDECSPSNFIGRDGHVTWTARAGHGRQCPFDSFCQNIVGSFECLCREGYYSNGGTGDHPSCTECSVACPRGMFESQPCSSTADRVCSVCSECDEYSIELSPCTTKNDRLCIHVAHPQGLVNKMAEPRLTEGLLIVTSPNVIVEDLHRTRNLETTYYVTDTTQASDFYWDRESGIRVNIGIHDVHLIAEYGDIDHAERNDNQFILGNHVDSDDRTKFHRAVDQFCRYPVPDYYSLTLEIARNRTTSARRVVCDSSGTVTSSLPRSPCPSHYSDGDTFLDRSINGACARAGIKEDQLQSAANSFVCVDETPRRAASRPPFSTSPNTDSLSFLFIDVVHDFRSPPGGAVPLSYPSRRCGAATGRCEACLSNQRCMASDITDRQCCQVDCLSLDACKESYSSQCRAPVECATGDAHRYTLQPVYRGGGPYRCHIRHGRMTSSSTASHVPTLEEPPPLTSAPTSLALYELFIFVQLPKVGYRTPTVHRTVPLGDLMHQRRGAHQVDFLTVEHDAGLDLQDEFILVSGAGVSKNTFTLIPVRESSAPDASSTGASSSVVSRDLRVLPAIQFERPFDYSSSTWGRPSTSSQSPPLSSDGSLAGSWCAAGLNATKIRPMNGVLSADGFIKSVMSRGVEVSAIVSPNIIDGSFRYFIQSVDSPPHFRFTVPGNTSILPYYFQDGSSKLIVDKSLAITLQPMWDSQSWHITIVGKMTDCPAYLSAKVIDRSSTSVDTVLEVARCDLLILCPPEFNISFLIPDTESTQSPWPGRSPRTFEIVLGNSRGTTLRIFQTFLAITDTTKDNLHSPEAIDSHSSAAALEINEINGEDHEQLITWPVTMVMSATVASTITIVIMLIIVRAIYAKITSVNRLHTSRDSASDCYCDNSQPHSTLTTSTSRHGQLPQVSPQPSQPRRQQPCSNVLVILGAYVVIRLIFSLLLTFSSVLPIVIAWSRPEVGHLAAVVDIGRGPCAALARRTIDALTAAEVSMVTEGNDQSRRSKAAAKSCNRHVTHLVDDVADVISGPAFERRLASSVFSVSRHFEQSIDKLFNSYTRSTVDAVATYRTKTNSIDKLIARYERRLANALEAPWLTFTRYLSNASTSSSRTRMSSHASLLTSSLKPQLSVATTTDAAIARLLEIEEREMVSRWTQLFWQRFNATIPLTPSRPRITYVNDSPGVTTVGPVIRCTMIADESPSKYGPSFDDRYRGRLLQRRRHRGDDRLDSVRFYSAFVTALTDDVIDVLHKPEVTNDEGKSSREMSLSLYQSPFTTQTKHDGDDDDILSAPPGDRYPYLRDLGGVAAVVWNVLVLVDALVIWRRVTWTYFGALQLWQTLSTPSIVNRKKSTCVRCELKTGNGLLERRQSSSDVAGCPSTHCNSHFYRQQFHVNDPSVAVNGGSNITRGRDQSCDVINRHDVVRNETSVSIQYHRCQHRWRCNRKLMSTACDAFYRCILVIFSDVTLPVGLLTVGSVSLLLASVGLVSSGFIGILVPLFGSRTQFTPIVDAGSENDFLNVRSGDSGKRYQPIVNLADTSLSQESSLQLNSLQSIVEAFNAALSQVIKSSADEICASMTPSSMTSSGACVNGDVTLLSVDHVHVTMIPCSLESWIYNQRADTHTVDYTVIHSYVTAARIVAMTIACAGVIVSATMTFSHLVGVAFFRHFGITQPLERHRRRLMSASQSTASNSAAANTPTSGTSCVRRTPPDFRLDGDNDRLSGVDEEEEFDKECGCCIDDNDDDETKSSKDCFTGRQTPKTGPCCRSTRSPNSSAAVVGIPLLGCRYSETKV